MAKGRDFPQVKFNCTGCAVCCKDSKSRRRKILLLEGEAVEIERLSGLRKKDFSVRSGRPDAYSRRMKKIGGACFFLGKDKRCRIYEKRPLVCMFYPFELSEKGEISVSRRKECEGLLEGSRVPRKFFEKLLIEAKRRFSRENI